MLHTHRPKLAVWKFASCDGCQLSLLDCEDHLLQLADLVQFAFFAEASSAIDPGPYDLSIVEGSISTPHDLQRIQEVRRSSRILITIGACATAGGIQALRNFNQAQDYAQTVYPTPEYLTYLEKSTAISEHVSVDFELRGCPINKEQLLEVISAFLQRRKPLIPEHAVCLECKKRQIVCLSVAQGIPCLGPITQAGCNALCPAYQRGCFGCYGVKESPNTSSMWQIWEQLGTRKVDRLNAFRGINAGSPALRQESESHEHKDG